MDGEKVVVVEFEHDGSKPENLDKDLHASSEVEEH
jgi:hypothetical protein